MLSKTAQLAMLLAVAAYFAVVIVFLRKKKLNMRYALTGLVCGVVMLVFVLFPRLLDAVAGLVGIYDQTSALFAILFFCLILYLVFLTALISQLNDRNKVLTQSVAILEKRVRELEKRENE